jgi:segregation and condensation protein A
VLKRLSQREDAREIYQDKWTVSEKIEHLMRLAGERASLKFSDLFEGAVTRSEVVCTFLALLELIRLKQLVAVQQEAFADIQIIPGPGMASATPASAAAPGAEAESAVPAVSVPGPQGLTGPA